jgi:ribosomal protein S18 acetylase RimI-like enzyme
VNTLTWRPAAAGDVEAIADLYEVIERSAPVDRNTEPVEVRLRLDSVDDSLLAVDSSGRALVLADVTDVGEAAGAVRVRVGAAIHPDADDEVRRRTHDWLLERAQRLRDERRPGMPAMLGTRCAAVDTAWLALLTGSGFEVVHWQYDYLRALDRPVDLVPPPDGVTIVLYDTRYDEPARLAHNEAYVDDPNARAYDAADWPGHTTTNPRYVAAASFVALAGDDVAAFLFSQEHDGDGFLDCLGTVAPWRRRGVGAAIVTRALAAHREAGYRRARLNVRSDNGDAVRLYDRLGFVHSGREYAICVRPAR